MRDQLIEVNEFIRECLPIVILISWLCMIAFVIKMLMMAPVR